MNQNKKLYINIDCEINVKRFYNQCKIYFLLVT